MKILYLHQYFATPNSETSNRSFEFAKRLVKKGHDVTIITTNAFLKKDKPDFINKKISYYNFEGIKVIAFESNYSNATKFVNRGWSFVSYLLRAIQINYGKKGFDLIFATSTPLTIGIPALVLSKKMRIPFVFEVRDLWPEAPIQLELLKSKIMIYVLKKLELMIYKKANHIITLSPGMSEGIIKTGIDSKKITLIPNLSNIDFFNNNVNKIKVNQLVQKKDLSNKFVLIHIGAMGIANGLEYLIETAKILKKEQHDQIVIMLVGKGMESQRLQDICSTYKLTNVLFEGSIQRKDVPSYTELGNITMTSFLNKEILSTNSPNKFFDSLAAGKPIIVNSNGWTKNIVEKESIGYYVNPEKPYELANLLVKLSQNPEKLILKKERIQAVAKEYFNVVDLSEKFVSVLEKSNKSI